MEGRRLPPELVGYPPKVEQSDGERSLLPRLLLRRRRLHLPRRAATLRIAQPKGHHHSQTIRDRSVSRLQYPAQMTVPLH